MKRRGKPNSSEKESPSASTQTSRPARGKESRRGMRTQKCRIDSPRKDPNGEEKEKAFPEKEGKAFPRERGFWQMGGKDSALDSTPKLRGGRGSRRKKALEKEG